MTLKEKYDIICQQWKKGERHMDIWKKEQEFDEELYDKVDKFYKQIEGMKKVEYRPGQSMMSFDICETIGNKEILVIEAGVGIGKSWAYLVPLIYASQNKDKFKGFLISTSSIALQEQLQKEVARVSEMLGIDIDVTIAKGKNNYLCQKRLEDFLKYEDKEKKYSYLKEKIRTDGVDKKEYNELPETVWEKINVQNVDCRHCMYRKDCQYTVIRKQWRKKPNIISNHGLLVEMLSKGSEEKLIEDPTLLVVDEAHGLIDTIIQYSKKTITSQSLDFLIYNIYSNIGRSIYEEIPLIKTIDKVFTLITKRAKRTYYESAKEYVEVLNDKTAGFTCTKKIKEEIEVLISQLQALEEEARKYPSTNKALFNQITMLKETRLLFSDIISKDKKNIYWASCLSDAKEHSELVYVPKNIAEIARNLLSNPSYGKVFTSATLTTGNNDYSYFMKGLGLDQMIGQPVFQEFSQPSPYNYDENALLYCATDVVSPKSKDRDLYLDSLTAKIDDLIETTNGRSLVLFTSKKDMQEVYRRLSEKKHDFNILVQEDGKNAEKLKEEFKQDTTSTLLATGTFWEGVDIKGESLEQVIIAKLPFPVVDPIIQERASHYADGFREVYLKEMLIKLKQGAGRLMRCGEDKGIVSILDSRAEEYAVDILSSLPFSNVTGSQEDVKEFVKQKLSHQPKEKAPEKQL